MEPRIDRLAIMADFLEAPERLGGVPRSDFDMTNVIDGDPKKLGHHCGSRACVIGWLPVVFPEFCRYRLNPAYGEEVVLKKNEFVDDFDAAARVFDMDDDDASELFNSREPEENFPEAVARDIREFIERKLESEAE